MNSRQDPTVSTTVVASGRFTAGPSARITAFGLAVVMTLSILASIERLAAQPAADAQWARQAAPAQVAATVARRAFGT